MHAAKNMIKKNTRMPVFSLTNDSIDRFFFFVGMMFHAITINNFKHVAIRISFHVFDTTIAALVTHYQFTIESFKTLLVRTGK